MDWKVAWSLSWEVTPVNQGAQVEEGQAAEGTDRSLSQMGQDGTALPRGGTPE